jgi:hypothetical protein
VCPGYWGVDRRGEIQPSSTDRMYHTLRHACEMQRGCQQPIYATQTSGRRDGQTTHCTWTVLLSHLFRRSHVPQNYQSVQGLTCQQGSYVMLCRAVPCCAVLCRAVPCRRWLCWRLTQWRVVPPTAGHAVAVTLIPGLPSSSASLKHSSQTQVSGGQQGSVGLLPATRGTHMHSRDSGVLQPGLTAAAAAAAAAQTHLQCLRQSQAGPL